ncbi:MAG: transcriptional repressor LexA [Chloroflexota bacterium]|nr:transcriptional repressor LexA [Dehalococcoidia bacterium]MDW8253980.1 transcriptional repressor LexA [Chloroflexota bacterium]
MRLSERQRKILEFVRQYTDEMGYPPSIRDICRGCGISSTSVVDYNLKLLEREGYLRRDPEVSRGIDLMDRKAEQRKLVRVPILGQIAAGTPIPVPASETWQTIDTSEVLELTEEIVRGRPNVYALRVKGQSMIDALIGDGDIVLMEPAQTAENGQMVAAWIKSQKETTLKKFYQEGDRVKLQPANALMEPLYFPAEDVEIQGRVVGVLRVLH